MHISNFTSLHETEGYKDDYLDRLLDNLKQKNKKPFPARTIAIKLSHISTFKDMQNRNGLVSASKWFWWSLKPIKK